MLRMAMEWRLSLMDSNTKGASLKDLKMGKEYLNFQRGLFMKGVSKMGTSKGMECIIEMMGGSTSATDSRTRWKDTER